MSWQDILKNDDKLLAKADRMEELSDLINVKEFFVAYREGSEFSHDDGLSSAIEAIDPPNKLDYDILSEIVRESTWKDFESGKENLLGVLEEYANTIREEAGRYQTDTRYRMQVDSDNDPAYYD